MWVRFVGAILGSIARVVGKIGSLGPWMVGQYCLHCNSGILHSRDGINVFVSCVFSGSIQEVTIC